MIPGHRECYQGDGFRLYLKGPTPSESGREVHFHEIHMDTTAPATISLFPAGSRYSRRGDPPEELVLELDSLNLERDLDDPRTSFELQQQEEIQDSRIQHLLCALHEDLRDGCPAAVVCAGALVNALRVYLARNYCVRREGPYRPVMPKARLNRVLAFIDDKADENLRLADLAKAAGMSIFHFAKLFKQSTGKSPHQYALTRRVEKAKRLLREEDVSVFEISVRTGFVDQRHFTKVFRRFTGSTPTAYRAAV